MCAREYAPAVTASAAHEEQGAINMAAVGF